VAWVTAVLVVPKEAPPVDGCPKEREGLEAPNKLVAGVPVLGVG